VLRSLLRRGLAQLAAQLLATSFPFRWIQFFSEWCAWLRSQPHQCFSLLENSVPHFSTLGTLLDFVQFM